MLVCSFGVEVDDLEGDYFALFHCCEERERHYTLQVCMYTHTHTQTPAAFLTDICTNSARRLAGGELSQKATSLISSCSFPPLLSSFLPTFFFLSPTLYVAPLHSSPVLSPTVLTRTYWHLDFHLSSLLVIDFRLYYSVSLLAPCC